MRRIGSAILYGLAAALIGLGARNLSNPHRPVPAPPLPPPPPGSASMDELVTTLWTEQGIAPAPNVDDLTFARRAALGIVGVIPSLEEVRWYEARPAETRRIDYVERLLSDRRFADTLAERLAQAWLPARVGDNFVLFRPFRFTEWLADQIDAGIPYARIVRQMLANDGLWTDSPAVNFITAYEGDPEELANQTAKNFLGLQLGCAQCHDHPFAPWKQSQFRGLAAHFGRTDITFRGIDDSGSMYRFGQEKDKEGTLVIPQVPYGTSTAATDASIRHSLANWVVDRSNERFRQTIANRVWQMMLGRPVTNSVDDLDTEPALPGLLAELAQPMDEEDHDLRALFRRIALSKPFQLASSLDTSSSTEGTEQRFASYPLTRLDPSQVARSLLQVSSVRTLDRDTGVVRRVVGFFERQNFVDFFRTSADDESGTISQRLMLMNDKLVGERIAAEMGSTAERLAEMAPTQENVVELAFLVGLTRRPTPTELAALAPRLTRTDGRWKHQDVEDLLWGIINSSEFLLRH